MKFSMLLLVLIIFISCEDTSDEYFINTEDVGYSERIMENHTSEIETVVYQRNQSDFNFIFRAHHSPQTVELTRSSGALDTLRFQGDVKFGTNGRAQGKIVIGNPGEGQVYRFVSGELKCDGATRSIEFEAVDPLPRGSGHSSSTIIVTASTQSSEDNPDCIIWDIKDSCTFEGGTLTAEGRITFALDNCGGPE